MDHGLPFPNSKCMRPRDRDLAMAGRFEDQGHGPVCAKAAASWQEYPTPPNLDPPRGRLFLPAAASSR